MLRLLILKKLPTKINQNCITLSKWKCMKLYRTTWKKALRWKYTYQVNAIKSSDFKDFNFDANLLKMPFMRDLYFSLLLSF